MQTINHAVLGSLLYEPEEGWRGWIQLPAFAKYANAEREIDEEPAPAEDYDPEYAEHLSELAELEDRRRQGFLPIVVADPDGGGLSAAQERTLRYLIDNETAVLETIVADVANVRQSYEDDTADEFGELNDMLKLAQGTAKADLTKFLTFGTVFVSSQPADGHVPVDWTYDAAWDDEHQGEVTTWKDQLADEEIGRPFPCSLPATVDLQAVPKRPDGLRLVEFKIRGRWTGLFAIDDQQQCIGYYRPPPFDAFFDPEQIEAVRPASGLRVFTASLPHARIWAVCGLSLALISPACLAAGWLGIPQLFLVSLVLTAGSFGVLSCYRAFRHYPGCMKGWAVIQLLAAGISLAVWRMYDPFADPNYSDNLAGFFGAVVWWVVLAATILGAGIPLLGIALTARGGTELDGVPKLLALPFLVFAAGSGTALYLTASGDWSKLHLLWTTPAAAVAALVLALAVAKWKIRRLARQIESQLHSQMEELLDRDER